MVKKGTAYFVVPFFLFQADYGIILMKIHMRDEIAEDKQLFRTGVHWRRKIDD